jgi:hypothetical protein
MGCTTTGSLTETIAGKLPTPMEEAVDLAVVIERETAQQDGKSIAGLIAQVLLVDERGQTAPAEGTISFNLYARVPGREERVEADQQWSFSADQVRESEIAVPLGRAHRFWLPINEGWASAPKIDVLTLYSPAHGGAVSQWNHVTAGKHPLAIQQTTDADELKAKISKAAEAPASSN